MNQQSWRCGGHLPEAELDDLPGQLHPGGVDEPFPCGYLGDGKRPCRCNRVQIERDAARIQAWEGGRFFGIRGASVTRGQLRLIHVDHAQNPVRGSRIVNHEAESAEESSVSGGPSLAAARVGSGSERRREPEKEGTFRIIFRTAVHRGTSARPGSWDYSDYSECPLSPMRPKSRSILTVRRPRRSCGQSRPIPCWTDLCFISGRSWLRTTPSPKRTFGKAGQPVVK